MNTMSPAISTDHTNLGFVARGARLLSWSLAAAVFLTVGWTALAPDDPLGALSLFARPDWIVSVVQIGGVAIVVATVAQLLCGRSVIDAGMFAVALGLMLVSLRGATAEYFLIHPNDAGLVSQRTIALGFAGESIVWMMAVVLAGVLSALVVRWCCGPNNHARTTDQLSSVEDIPVLGAFLRANDKRRATPSSVGLKHFALSTGVGVIAYKVLSTGLAFRVIQHGQACFVVAASVGIAAYVANRLAPVRSPLWAVLSVGAMSVVGYVWASLQPIAHELPANIPASHFLRVLPVQFVAVGTGMAILMTRSMYDPHQLPQDDVPRTPISTTRAKGRR